MQNEIDTLLRRWAELAPDECRIVDDQGIAILLGNGELSPYLDYSDVTDLFVIQGAVQEAIEARGWEWKLESIGGRATGYVSHGDTQRHERAQNPAAALLTAYLSAIEAQNADAR